jgi:RimJ/RimL family protein N-acetyltransferase
LLLKEPMTMAALPNFELGARFLSFCAGGEPITVSRRNDTLMVSEPGNAALRLHLSPAEGRLRLGSPTRGDNAVLRHVLAAIEAALAWHPELEQLTLELGDEAITLSEEMHRRGVVLDTTAGALVVLPAMFMQQAELWLGNPTLPPFPQCYVMTDGKRHPRRPPKPRGTVYARYIPWIEQTLAFRVATVAEDADYLHKWMNDPRVAAFWNEEGDLEKQRRYLARLIADPHMLPLIATFDGVPFGYFETYWAKENRLAPYYDAQDYDRGWHVVVGEDTYRGRRFISAWLPSLQHYLLLDESRTQRIVGEPAAAHRQQIRNLETSGYAHIKTFDFPHKRAALVMLLRERFFADRLWLPADLAQPVH